MTDKYRYHDFKSNPSDIPVEELSISGGQSRYSVAVLVYCVDDFVAVDNYDYALMRWWRKPEFDIIGWRYIPDVYE